MLEVHSHPCFLTPTPLRPNYPLLVFLPGMDGTGQLLRSQTAGLETGFDVRCLAIPPDDLTDWETLAARVIQLIENELKPHPPRPVYLCGESFGACLAQKIVVRAPQLISRLILVNPASSFNRRPWIRWGTSISQYFPEALYRLSAVALMPFLAILGRLAEQERQALWEAMSSVPQKTSIWRISLLKDFDIDEAQLRQVSQPTLLIAGASDRLLPSVAEVQRLNNHLPNAKIVILPDSGHACLLETAINFYQILQENDFLEQNSPQMASSIS